MLRRSFIAGLIAAPAIVRAESLMKLAQRDDTAWVQWQLDRAGFVLPGRYVLRSSLVMPSNALIQDCHFSVHSATALYIPSDTHHSIVRRCSFFGEG